jgi:putative nucleotidyltransferase with HDIG domain
MRDLASHLKADPEMWGIVGLVHDIDYDQTANDPAMHGVRGAEILEGLGFDPEIIYAVKAHNPHNAVERKRKVDKALFCADPVSGLITAGALILPSKKLEDVSVEFILKRMAEKSFARGANREQIMKCDDIALKLEDFIEISLSAMKKISAELGL